MRQLGSRQTSGHTSGFQHFKSQLGMFGTTWLRSPTNKAARSAIGKHAKIFENLVAPTWESGELEKSGQGRGPSKLACYLAYQEDII